MFRKLSGLAACLAMLASIASTAQAQTYSISDAQCSEPVAGCATPVGATGCGTLGCNKPGCTSCGHAVAGCATCDSGCSLEIKEEKVKKTCFEIECKTICIPTVQLPFGICCKPLSARSKTIKVLKTKSTEVPVTKYVWTHPEKGCATCGSSACRGGCATCAQAVPTTWEAAPTPAVTAEAQLQTPPQPAQPVAQPTTLNLNGN